MTEFKVLPIENMIRLYPELPKQYSFKKGDIQIITITRDEKYEYNFTPLVELDFDDITKQDLNVMDKDIQKKFTFVSEKHVERVVEKLPEIKNAHIIFVCCDAGLSRSPAVAQALAHYLGEGREYCNLSYRYPFANNDVFETMLLGLQKHTQNIVNSKSVK